MSTKYTKTESKRRRASWTTLQKMPDQDIDYSDIPPTDAKFWEKAQVALPSVKTHYVLTVGRRCRGIV